MDTSPLPLATDVEPSPLHSEARVAMVVTSLTAAVAICGLLLLFAIVLLDAITEYDLGAIPLLVLAAILTTGNAALAWISFRGAQGLIAIKGAGPTGPTGRY
jgi:hypothetical protein